MAEKNYKRVALAFSGGLDTSWCVPWIREELGAEVVTVTVDVGGLDDAGRAVLAARSKELGATEHIILDARQVFFEEVLQFLIMGNVLRGNAYPLCVGAERSLQAREVARIAAEIGADAVAHGCTAAGNDQVRFEVALRTVAGDLDIVAPIRDLHPSRSEEASFLKERGFAVDESTAVYSENSGLWGVTIGGKETTDTRESLPDEAWVRTRNAFSDPQEPQRHTVGFKGGVPCTLDGSALDPVTLIEKLDEIAAAFGIGRGIHLGDTVLGLKGRVAFEAPAAITLITAHRELEKLTLTGRQQRLKDTVSGLYGDLVHEGQLLEPTCRDIEALLVSSQKRVTGEVTLFMRPGSLFVEGVTSPHSLRDASSAVYGEAASEYTSEDARGFSRLLALPGMLHTRAGGEA